MCAIPQCGRKVEWSEANGDMKFNIAPATPGCRSEIIQGTPSLVVGKGGVGGSDQLNQYYGNMAKKRKKNSGAAGGQSQHGSMPGSSQDNLQAVGSTADQPIVLAVDELPCTAMDDDVGISDDEMEQVDYTIKTEIGDDGVEEGAENAGLLEAICDRMAKVKERPFIPDVETGRIVEKVMESKIDVQIRVWIPSVLR